jgi:hypothetical protein
VLQNTKGEFQLLADLVNEALRDADESDAVVLLGPASKPVDRIPAAGRLLPRPQRKTGLYYLQFQAIRPPLPTGDPLPSPDTRRGMSIAYGRDRTSKIEPTSYEGNVNGQDAIGRAVEHLKGRIFAIRQPADFARAIRTINLDGK